MITPTKLTILLQFLKWQKFCEGILCIYDNGNSIGPLMRNTFGTLLEHFSNSLGTFLEWVLVGPSTSFTNESIKKTTTK